MAGFFDWLFGATQPPAPKLQAFPTPEDAAFAQQAGIGYGTPMDAYVEGLVANVLGGTKKGKKVDVFQPKSATDIRSLEKIVDPSQSKSLVEGQSGVPGNILPKTADAFTQAMLASNYVPIAALGMAPSRTVLDVSGVPSTLAGFQLPGPDKMYVNLNSPNTIVHESAHRGFDQVKDNPALPPDIARRLKSQEGEELLVRYLMKNFAGNPEQSPIAKQQQALSEINPPNPQDIRALNAIIADILAKSKPRGPR